MIEDLPYAGDELQVIPSQPTVPSNLLMSGPSLAGNIEEYPRTSLPSYEEMMLDDMFNGPSSMETQPDLAPVKVLEEGVAVTQDGRTMEWWPVEEPEQMGNMLEYLEDENKPPQRTRPSVYLPCLFWKYAEQADCSRSLV